MDILLILLAVCSVVIGGAIVYVKHQRRALHAAMAPAEAVLNAKLKAPLLSSRCSVTGMYKGREVACVVRFGKTWDFKFNPYSLTMKLQSMGKNRILESFPEVKKKYLLQESTLFSREAEYECSRVFGQLEYIQKFNTERFSIVLEDMYKTAEMLEQEGSAM